MFIKPDYNLKNIYELPIQELKDANIKAILLDLDSTVMVSKSGKYLPETLKWFEEVKKDFKLAIVTNNNNPNYLKMVHESTDFPVITDAKKPKTNGIDEALKILGVKREEAIMVGDRPLTDILAGKNAKMKTALVGSINAENEDFLVKFVRNLERITIKK